MVQEVRHVSASGPTENRLALHPDWPGWGRQIAPGRKHAEERYGTKRSVTPIIKPPRPRHLQLGQEYAAELATLYPDQAVVQQPVTMTVAEAEQRFYARYGQAIGGTSWSAVEAFLGYQSEEPQTVAEWIELATEVKAQVGVQEQTSARLAGKRRS